MTRKMTEVTSRSQDGPGDDPRKGYRARYDHKHFDPNRNRKPENMSNTSGCNLAATLAEKIVSFSPERQLLTVKNSEDNELLQKIAELTQHETVKTAILQKINPPVEIDAEEDYG